MRRILRGVAALAFAVSLHAVASAEPADAIERKVSEVVARHPGVDARKVRPDADIMADLGVDDLGHVEIVMAVEQAFGVSIADEDAETVFTVGDMIALVKRLKPRH